MSAKKSTVERWVADKSLNAEKWLRFVSDEKDNVTTLWCEICKTYKNRIMGVKNFSNKYTEGTANIKLDMVKKHACSDQHNLAIRLHQGEEKKKSEYRSESENSIVRSFRKQEGHIFEGIRRLMQISYVVAKEELVFQIFPKLVELEKLHVVTFGDGYAHDKACCEFIDCIEEATLQDLAKIVSKSSYFSVLVDGSTDSSTIERESVFIMFLADGTSHIRFLSLEKAISCDAPGVVKSIESALERIGLTTEDWKRKCIGLGCDGASVNLGVRNGVVARMRADGVPWLVGVHCYNHRLELAIKEALNKTYFTEIVAELDFLYHLYKNSPKKLRELKELGNILDAAASKPGKCYGSRWVGHKVSALKKLQNCYSIYVAHLEQLVEDPSSTSTAADKAKFKGHLSKMKRYTFVYYVHFFLDLLTSVNSLSLVLQQENINIVTTITAVGNLKDKLDLLVHDLEADQVDIEDTADSSLETVATNIRQTPYSTTYLHSFEENFKHDDLSGHKQTPVHVGAIVNNVRACIEERFSRECMEGGVLPNASLILNVKAWPVGNDALNLFGNANVVSLVKHFKTPLEHALAIKLTEEEVVEEFHILKYVVRDQFQILLQEANSMTEFWHRILICNDVRLLTSKVMKLIEILLVLPISNASVERMFSTMNRVVTDVRTSLGEQRLSSLIRISDEGCSVHDFNFEPALEIWIAKKNRRGGYKKQKTAGVISLLDEPDSQLKYFALRKMNTIVSVFWPEISEAVDKIEVLYEDDTFKQRELAALVASKVYYHLGAYEESLTYALGAGSLFDVNDKSEYVETIIAKCIDHYTKLRVSNAEALEDDQKVIDPRLETIVNRMFRRCFDDRQYKQAVGIALETRRIDIFEEAITSSDDIQGMLSYCLKICMALIQNRQFSNTVLKVLTKLYMGLDTADYINVCQCYIFLDDPKSVADILEKLIKDNEDTVIVAYQIAFDLYESATQQFLQRVQSALRATAPIPIPESKEKRPTETQETKSGEKEETNDKEVETEESEPVVTLKEENLSEEDKVLQDRVVKLSVILGGETTIGLHLQFLVRNNKTDMLILKNTKDAVRNSVCHTATVIANSFMHCGTTSDQFLRDNLEWLARATNWAKFTATASLGVIHKGHEKEALSLMSTYLPKETGPGSAYSEGGGLYALGLIHANHGGDITDYLLNKLSDASNEMVRHGGCLGLGLAAMGTARQDVYEQLKFNLYQDDAVTGEAAGLAMGLVMLGTKSASAIEDMVAYAQETQHEKILRGLAMGIALTMYGRLEEADGLIESLSRDKDPILRWSGIYTLAMAYCGSGNNQAIRRLLHVAVSDVNDDVRRVAVTSLGFLLFRNPEQCPSVVSLLSESYNPHVRFGAAMALGIACAGTGLKDAINLLEPMANDRVNYVRQGALMASALVLVQQNEITCPKVTHFRQLYAKVIADKHEDIMAKFGAIIAQGILDAGGRNMTISLQSRTGHTNTEAVVGLMVFCQCWFWFPLAHFLSLTFSPTCLIGLNQELKMPKIEFRSGAKPSVYAYPPALEEKKDKMKEKVETAVLSITAKQKKKEAEKKEKEEKMEVDDEKKDEGQEKAVPEKEQPESKDSTDTEKPESMDTSGSEVKESNRDPDATVDKTKEEKPADKEEKEPEATFEMLSNPARVMKAQLKVLSLSDGSTRYAPIKDVSIGGIIMMKNCQPEQQEDIVEPVIAGGPKVEEEEEPEPPEPFEWTED